MIPVKIKGNKNKYILNPTIQQSPTHNVNL